MRLKIDLDGDPTSNRCKLICVLTQIWLQRWLPIPRLLAARFSTDLKQLPGVPWFLGIPGNPGINRGDRANDTSTHPADVLQSKIKSFYTDGRRQKMEFFPADVFPRKYVQKFSDRRRHLNHSKFFWLIWKNFMITWKILPTSFRKNLNKNSHIDVVMWRVRDFPGNM